MQLIYEFNCKYINDLYALYRQEWWTNTRTLAETKACIVGSQICIGLVDDTDHLVGFARVLTDYTFKALLFDVIVAEKNRGAGMGKQLMSAVLKHPALSAVKSFELYCLPEMLSFYQGQGFSEEVGDIKLMRLP